MKLERKVEQYANCTPAAVAGGSKAQMMYFVEDAKKDIAALAAALAAKDAEIDALKAALEPFAQEAEAWADSVPDDHRSLCTEPGSSTAHPGSETNFTVGDIRAARAALKEKAE